MYLRAAPPTTTGLLTTGLLTTGLLTVGLLTVGLLTVGLLTVGLLTMTPAVAGTHDILIGLDAKITYRADGPVNSAPGKDAVLVVDVSDPARPRVRASLPLMNSLLGPPTNLQITPDGTLGLVANSVVMNQDANAWKPSPDNKLFVIDLASEPPNLKDTVTVGMQPSGMAISHKGDLALTANRNGKSVSVLSIKDGVVRFVGDVALEQEAAAVAIAPDGKRAFVCLNLVNRIAVLTIDGQTVTYDKSLDIPSAINPYNIDITPDGQYAIASNTGAMKNNGDAEVIIEAAGPHPHVVDIMSPGNGPEGFADFAGRKMGGGAAAAWVWGEGQRLVQDQGRGTGCHVDRRGGQADGHRQGCAGWTAGGNRIQPGQ